MPIKVLTDNNPEGTIIGASPTDRLGFFGALPLPQRSSPMQMQIQALNCGSIMTVQASGIAATSIPPNTTAEISITVPNGVIHVNDFVMAVNKPAAQAGIGVTGFRNGVLSAVSVSMCNATAATVGLTANEAWNVVIARGLNTFSQALSPVTVAANTTAEQIFTIAGSGAAGTALVNAAGQVTGVRVTAAGSNYAVPPTVVFTEAGYQMPVSLASGVTVGAAVTPSVLSGYGGLLPGQGTGVGAGGMAIINGGTVVGVQILSQGGGYNASYPPTVSFIGGGNQLSTGVVVSVQKNANQAGLGIVGCRVVGNNQVGITYQNFTAAAILPTASETYTFYACNDIAPLNNVVQYGFAPGIFTSVTSATSCEFAISMAGAVTTVTTDLFIGGAENVGNGFTTTAGLSWPHLKVSVTTAATAVLTLLNSTVAAVTGLAAGQVLAANCNKLQAPNPVSMYFPYLTSVAVAVNTTAEQTYTVTGLIAGSTVLVNKLTPFTNNLVLVGARVSAANTLALTWANNSAVTATPVAEIFQVANFPVIPPGGGPSTAGGLSGNFAKQDVCQTVNECMDFAGEIQMDMVLAGIIKGG